ncbi:MAG: DegT/DnrJ/EryC1/StrS family aminotransferase [Cytophagaceae bacterium]|nr:DegT/DnrJ/EryC1/StrS family aminotransferase [Cytophagaceae bacterium]
MNIPFFPLKKLNEPYHSEFKEIFEEFLDSGYYILGEGVKSFESEFANYCNAKHAIGVANGLDALEMILESLELPENSEVIVPANTYYASIISIINVGLKPVLTEPNYHDYLRNSEEVIKNITKNTKAIMGVNLYGKMCDYDALIKICNENNLYLIIDAAQSHGAEYHGKKHIQEAIATAYSFYPTKNLGALSDAGAVVTDNKDVYEKIIKLRNYGSKTRYNFEVIGRNSRLSELQAKLLSLKLKHLDNEIIKRREIADFYLKNIQNPYIILPENDTVFEDSWHLFVVKVQNREKFTQYLKDSGIGYDIHYPKAPHHQEALKMYKDISLPVTEKLHQEVVSIPINSALDNEEISYISDRINKFTL